jgi:molybdate/tungstate transport system substrate-binding protein
MGIKQIWSLNAVMVFVIIFTVFSCKGRQSKSLKEDQILSVFHAGSLAVPMRNLASAFESENPGVKIQLEAGGSLASLRKITELNQICDVLALADYSLIDELLIPEFAQWNILFASNELCLAYSDHSKMSDQINNQNWFEVLMNPDVRYGRSDPDADPCGYRTILTLKLADRFYPDGKNWQDLLDKDNRFIRGKETDLNVLLESRTIDYMFNYKSVAVQHGFRYLSFPDSINLGNPLLSNWYSVVSVETRGSGPNTKISQTGASIVYGLTIPSNALNEELAKKFIRFMIDPDKGRKIIEQSGQRAIRPKYSDKSRNTSDLF